MLDHLPWAVLAVWAVKDIYTTFKDDKRRNTDALTTATHAIIELRTEIKNMRELLAEVPKIRRDVDAAHSKLREKSL
jgi:hypothetical protein